MENTNSCSSVLGHLELMIKLSGLKRAWVAPPLHLCFLQHTLGVTYLYACRAAMVLPSSQFWHLHNVGFSFTALHSGLLGLSGTRTLPYIVWPQGSLEPQCKTAWLLNPASFMPLKQVSCECFQTHSAARSEWTVASLTSCYQFFVSYDVAAMKQPMERFISVTYSILTNLFSISYIHTMVGGCCFFSFCEEGSHYVALSGVELTR